MDFGFVTIQWWQTLQSLKMQSFKTKITKFYIAFYKFSPSSKIKPTKEIGMVFTMCLMMKLSLEMKMATHSSILTWEIPWTEETGGPQPRGHKRVGFNLATQQQHRHQQSHIETDLGAQTLPHQDIKGSHSLCWTCCLLCEYLSWFSSSV